MPKYKTYTALLFLVCVCIINDIYSQRQADRWYFGHKCGLNFNTGIPEVLHNGHTYEEFGGIGAMSDSLGNLLFYSESDTIFTSQHLPMENGVDFVNAGGLQSNLIVQWPESDSLYFLFKTPTLGGDVGLYYSIIDISLNNGLGAVIDKNILLEYAWDAADKVTATLHKNKRDIWVITRKFRDDSFAVFLITPSGINEIPILSPVPDIEGENTDRGFIKISYDKKFLFSCYWHEKVVEICHFNDETGEIIFQYNLNIGLNPDDIEFSPDSRFAYISYQTGTSSPVTIKQYNMDFVDDVSLFITNAIDVGIGIGYGLQLATDGKIYCIDNAAYLTSPEYFVGVINKPWELGTACQYDSMAVFMYPGSTSTSVPNIQMDYLYRFEFEGLCSGTPFQFTSNFNPIPDSIRWLFNDFASGINNVSYEINPEHIFTTGGIFEVEVDVWYPSGRFEHTSREIEVEYAPSPDLGPDIQICKNDTIELDAGNGPGMYLWSNGTFGHNIFTISISDTGTYWVQVTNTGGCTTTDSIHVSWFEEPVFNDDNLLITPASCSGSNGSIEGIHVDGVSPLSFEWYYSSDSLLGTNLDIYNLTVGNYFLHVIDGNGCIATSDSYTIIDVGDIQITYVDLTNSHCMQNNGVIVIEAISGSSSTFEYSVINNDWQADSIFENLPPANYFVSVRDQLGCETVYGNNPVIIENIPGPQITSIVVTPENDYSSDGNINIEADVIEGDINYSIDNGNTFQLNDGLFENLSAGSYSCVVEDEFGCDTSFTIEIDRNITQIIDALAGDGYTCIGNAASSPLLFSNFTDVKSFHVMLTYNKELINCDAYMHVHPELQDSLQISINTIGEVHISWQGQFPVSLPDSSLLAELVFRGIDQGLSQVDWIVEQGESQFFNENGEQINTDFQLGMVIIYTRPDIVFSPSVDEVCEGQTLIIAPSISGGTGEYKSSWTGPNNFTSENSMLYFSKSLSSMAGTYILTVTDTINCVESNSMQLIVNQNPIITFTSNDTLWVEPGYILEAGSDYNNIYQWNTGETTPEIEIDTTGLYDVTVTSLKNCTSNDTVRILWGGDPFYLPNAFTPNSDGLNDEFAVVQKYDYIKKFHMAIYNRWGQLIFETIDINNGWDGTYQGSPCMLGAYVYRIVYEEFGQQPVESKFVEGTVMLVR